MTKVTIKYHNQKGFKLPIYGILQYIVYTLSRFVIIGHVTLGKKKTKAE